MNLALFTHATVILFYRLEILQPILPNSPSDHHNYLLQGSTISRESLQVVFLSREDNYVLDVPQAVSRGTGP
jgi:hypothetical protein